MKVVISQPMYLPWAGLFEQIKLTDIFIHYDDAMFPMGRSFCSRVQIKIEEQLKWLTVPVVRKSRTVINDTLIDYSKNWIKEHLIKIKLAYSKLKFYKDITEIVENAFNIKFINICDLNIYLIEKICDYLGIKTKFVLSSAFNLNTSSSQKLLELCKVHDATEYITGHGAKNYLDHELFEKNNIKVKYMSYNIVPYCQPGTFTPYVTILDLIANVGANAISHMGSAKIDWKKFVNYG